MLRRLALAVSLVTLPAISCADPYGPIYGPSWWINRFPAGYSPSVKPDVWPPLDGVINIVRDFGCRCDGVFDDTACAQAALNAACTITAPNVVTHLFPSVGVFVPPGVCRANVRIQCSNVRLFGTGGSKLVAASQASPVVNVTSDATTGQIYGVSVHGLFIDGGAADASNVGGAIGLQLQAVSPYVVSASNFRDLRFRNTSTALSMVNGAAFEVFENNFDNLVSYFTSSDAYVVSGIYNTFRHVVAANTGTAVRAWNDASSWHTSVTGLAADGQIRVEGSYANMSKLTIETIVGSIPGGVANGAFRVGGTQNTLRQVSVTNVAHTKANYGIDFVTAGPNFLSDYRVIASANDDAHRPQYPVSLEVGSGGVITNATAPGLFTIEQAMSASILANWTYSGSLSGVSSYVPISADRGDANVTLSSGIDSEFQTFATALTANRTVTLNAVGKVGAHFRIVRTGLGAFTLAVGALKTIPAGTAAFVDVTYNGTAWQLTGYGTL